MPLMYLHHAVAFVTDQQANELDYNVSVIY